MAEEGVEDSKWKITEIQRLSRKILAPFYLLCILLFPPQISVFLGFPPLPSTPLPSPPLPFPFFLLHKIFLADMIQIHSFDWVLNWQFPNLLSLAQMSLVTCRLICSTPYLVFPEGPIHRPSTRGPGEVDFTLLLSQWVHLSLFYGCRQKKRDSWFRDKGP